MNLEYAVSKNMGHELELENNFMQKKNAVLKYFWAGFILYTVVYAVEFASANYLKVYIYAQLAGVFLFILAGVNLIQLRIENSYLKVAYFFYCIWMLITIKRGFAFNGAFIMNVFITASSGVFLYLMPVVLLFPKRLAFYKRLFDIIVLLGILYLLLDVYFIKHLLSRDRDSVEGQSAVEILALYLSLPIGFLLLTLSYHTRKRRLFAIGVFTLSLLFAVIRARRGLIFMHLVSIFFSFLLFFFMTRKKVIIITFTSIIVLFGSSIVIQRFNSRSGVFGFLVERGTEDTRTPVEDCFYDDMKTKDWIIGRGIKGDYFCPIVEEDSDIRGYRATIETGYLQIILKGGIVSLGLLLLVTVPAMIRGIFFSKNLLSKAAGCWILIWLISLYPANVATFSLYYFLVWISVGICYSRTITEMSENQVRECFGLANITDVEKTENDILQHSSQKSFNLKS